MESQNKGGNFYQIQNRSYCNHCALHCPSLFFPPCNSSQFQQLNQYQQHRINNIRSALRNAQASQAQEPINIQRHSTPARQAHPHNPPNRFNTFPQNMQPNPWAPGFNHHNGLPFNHPVNRFFDGYSLPYPTKPSTAQPQG